MDDKMKEKIREFEERCWRFFNAVVRLLEEDPDIEVEMERTALNPALGLAQVHVCIGASQYLVNFDARCNYVDLLDVDQRLRVVKWELRPLVPAESQEWLVAKLKLVAELKKKLQPN